MQECAVLDAAYLNRLSARIALALDDIVPRPMRVVVGAESSVAWGTHPFELALGFPFTDNVLDNQALNPEKPATWVIEMVADYMLEALQQHITMERKVPWPAVARKPLGYFADPVARIVNDSLRLSFEVDGEALVSVSVPLERL